MTTTVPESPARPPTNAVRVQDIVDIDLSDPSSYGDGFPHAEVAQLRRVAPVAWHDEIHFPPDRPDAGGGGLIPSAGFWAVTGHALVDEVSRTPEVFSSSAGGTALFSSPEAGLVIKRQMMLNMDSPGHTRLRHILQPIFTPRAVQVLKDSIVQHTKEIVDEIATKGSCELVYSVSSELPVRVLASLLGMPYEDRRMLFEWTNALMASDDPEADLDPATFAMAAGQMLEYGQRIADDRRAAPREDIVSMIVNAEVDGERLTDVDFALFWVLLVVAGNETTRNTISGGVIGLAEHRLWNSLRDNRDLLPTAIDEILRYVSPVIHFRRTALRDAELGGQQVRAGDKVVVFYPAANRDPLVFDRPDELVLDRSPNPHLAFGVGPHFCLGSHLAKLQLSTMFTELLDRFDTLEVTGEVKRLRSNFISGVQELPVSFTAA